VPGRILDSMAGWAVAVQDSSSGGVFWGFLAARLGAIVVGIGLLWLEMRVPRRKSVEIANQDGRRVEVSIKSIGQRVQSALSAVPDVQKVKSRVVSRGKKVDVHLDAQVHPAVDLPSKTQELSDVTRDVLQNQIGVMVGRVRVSLQDGPDRQRKVSELSEPTPAAEVMGWDEPTAAPIIEATSKQELVNLEPIEKESPEVVPVNELAEETAAEVLDVLEPPIDDNPF